MFRRIAKLVAFATAMWALGRFLAARETEGDESSDEFSVATYCGGKAWASTSGALRRGRVRAALGGVDLDLRGATLDPAGADLLVEAYMGGVQVTVPETWRVSVETDAKAGGVDVRTPSPDDLPEDAPSLRLTARARMGGVAVAPKGA